MKLTSFSRMTEQLVRLLDKAYDAPAISTYIKALIEKVRDCDARVYLIASQTPEAEYLTNFTGDPALILALHAAWQRCLESSNAEETTAAPLWLEMRPYGQPIMGEKENLYYTIFQSLADRSHNTFFLLLPEQASFDPFLQSLFYVALFWHLQRGEFPLHASAVRMGEHLLLFSGPSDIGKTTIAKLLTGLGGELIDEDRVLVRKGSDGSYYARGWGYSLTPCEVPIRTIFRLEQSDHPQVKRISQIDLARFLISRSQEVVHHPYPDEVFLPLFNFISKVTRVIPGYHLKFEKSPSFWPHIEQELNL